MHSEDTASQNFSAKLLWGILGFASLGAFGFTILHLADLNLQGLFILSVAFAIAALINQHQLAIPGTSIKLSAKELTAFFGTIWLGVPGAVLLSACASVARLNLTKKSRFDWIYSIFNNIVSTFAAAFSFYFMLRQLGGPDTPILGEQAVDPAILASALAISAATHFLLTRIFNSLFAIAKRKEVVYEPLKRQLLRTLAPYVINYGNALLNHFVFLFFGLAFGWVVLAVTAVSHLAYRIYSERLEQKVKEIVEASRIHLATVEALATAIDARDQVGRGHVRRTQIYAVGIGEMMGLPYEDIQALRTGALLHDIGKLAVPDHILNKPGRLTPAEMEKIKIHASVGASILEAIGFSEPVIPTIKYHHESWDGTGYPEGLKAKKIPLTARILSVADAYDTLRGARPYRAAVTREEARRFLVNGAGTQFDPTVVDIFCRNLAQFEDRILKEDLAYEFDSVAEEESFKAAGESKSYIEQIKRANREVFTLYELARTFSSSLTTENIYSLFAAKIRELVPFDTCVIYQHNELTDEAQAVYTEGLNGEEIKHIYVKSGEGGTGFALKKRQAYASNVPNLDFSFSQVSLSYEYTAMASLPLIAKERLLGAVSIYSCSIDEYEDEHLRLLETVSRIASDAIFKSINHAESESRALTDPMTGLPNARSLQIQFEKESARSDRNNSKFQVLMLDLDGFKAVNDTFGHKVGDKLLKEIAKVMRGQLRDYDFIARYAGDEFVGIIPETDNRSVQELCQRIEKAVANFVLPIGDGRFAKVAISIGAAAYPSGGKMLDQLLIAADKAMYEVKVRRKRLAALKPAQEVKPGIADQQIKQPGPETDSQTPPPITVKPTDPVLIDSKDLIVESQDENFLVELDESHIISSAIN
jgi:diguanylate cyclase (GGDEF)-like protein/putative nucleotidyltransferase with HDIG domain